MKLYKILKMRGNHGVSVFPPEEQELPDPDALAGDPWAHNFRILRGLGFTDQQAGKALRAWAYHARYTLRQGPAGVRRFVEHCVRETTQQAVPPPSIGWGLVVLVAVLVAMALGLVLWVYLDQEINIIFGTHPWAYVMIYNERLWQGEILNVGSEQRGYYESGALFGGVVADHAYGSSGVGGKDWLWFKPGSMTLQGRRLIFYHVYWLTGFYVEFLGVLTRLNVSLFKLQEWGHDPYLPRGPWSRPGGRWGQEDYEGCWQEFFWL